MAIEIPDNFLSHAHSYHQIYEKSFTGELKLNLKKLPQSEIESIRFDLEHEKDC